MSTNECCVFDGENGDNLDGRDKYRYPKWAGLYEEDERYLHINRGVGFLAFSGRVGIPPEISVLTLRKAI